tara:strand:- start:899 stop:1504 length:606 start_codon:yes stop_codon:yes gene_type:complete
MNRKPHWENIYQNKKNDNVSWYQKKPEDSINLIESFSENKSDKIIDIGCGAGFLTDNLIKLGFLDITVIDISANAINKLRKRINNKNVNYIENDILSFSTKKTFKIWHDRAVFHFLTKRDDINKYISICNRLIDKSGFLIIGTFSEDGPLKCSGLDIKRYSVKDLKNLFKDNFRLIKGYKKIHKTPFNSYQSFTFCVLKKH